MKIFKLCSRAAVPVALAALAFTLGCGGSSDYSYVKVIHASPGAPNVDVKAGGDFATKDLAFGSASSPYTKVHAGTNRNLQVFAAGKDSTALLSAQRTLMKNQYYTVIALNVPGSLEAAVENDDLTPPTTGNFKIRVVHAAPSAGNVDVYVTAPGVQIDDPKHPVTPTLSDFAFDTVTKYLEVPSGTYQIRVTPTGNPGVVAIDTGAQGVTIAAGTIFTAVALNPDPNVTGATFSLLLTQDEPVAGVTPTTPSGM